MPPRQSTVGACVCPAASNRLPRGSFFGGRGSVSLAADRRTDPLPSEKRMWFGSAPAWWPRGSEMQARDSSGWRGRAARWWTWGCCRWWWRGENFCGASVRERDTGCGGGAFSRVRCGERETRRGDLSARSAAQPTEELSALVLRRGVSHQRVSTARQQLPSEAHGRAFHRSTCTRSAQQDHRGFMVAPPRTQNA